MMNVTLLTVGKCSEKYLADGCAEYQKRLGAFCRLHIIEVPEYRLPQEPSPAQIEEGLRKEGEVILARIPSGSFTAALCIEGQELSSPALADRLGSLGVRGCSSVCLIIGGSFGLSEAVKAACSLRLSMSPMTFPHQLARLMLLEQLYRAYSILGGRKYHK